MAKVKANSLANSTARQAAIASTISIAVGSEFFCENKATIANPSELRITTSSPTSLDSSNIALLKLTLYQS
nr:hypothetical protein CFP56_32838 [Quercus suber]